MEPQRPNRWGLDLEPIEEYLGDGIRFEHEPKVLEAREQLAAPINSLYIYIWLAALGVLVISLTSSRSKPKASTIR